MNALLAILIYAGIVHGIFVDGTYWKIYFALLAMYTVFVTLAKNSKQNPKRKSLIIASWSGK